MTEEIVHTVFYTIFLLPSRIRHNRIQCSFSFLHSLFNLKPTAYLLTHIKNLIHFIARSTQNSCSRDVLPSPLSPVQSVLRTSLSTKFYHYYISVIKLLRNTYWLFSLLKLAQPCVAAAIPKQARIYASFPTTPYISLNCSCKDISSTTFKVRYRITPVNLSILSSKICVFSISFRYRGLNS